MLFDHGDAEDSNYQPHSEEEISPRNNEFVIPEEPLEQECLHQRLIATARSLKKQKQRLKDAHDTLNDKWNKVLAADEKYSCNRQTRGYPKRKLLPGFDDEAIAPIPPKNNTADKPDRPPRGRDRAASNAVHKPAPPPRKGREVAAQDHTHDLRENLDKKAGKARSIYGSRDRAPTRDCGYQAKYAGHMPFRSRYRTLQPSNPRHDTAKYRGAAHALCFTDEVLDHEFLEGFKPVKIEAYDGTTDPVV